MTDSTLASRADYRHFLNIPTRWMDNDVYGHVNNTVYYSYFDTVINAYLIERGVLDYAAGATIGLAVENGCRYRRSLEFPMVIAAGLRVGKLGNSSVRYEVGLFAPEEDEPAAEGFFVHVFVDRQTRRPTPITGSLRDALSLLTIP